MNSSFKVRTKDRTPLYLDELERHFANITDDFEEAKKELFSLQVSKYGGREWEEARKRCYNLTQQILKIKKELERVRKAQ